MGGSGSTMQHQEMAYESHAPPPYVDMNMIFKGIPKMMQVADDMHRMTDYIMDLRNLTYGLVAISAIGVLCFVILRILQGRSKRKRRSLRHHEDGPMLPRYYYQSHYVPEPWERPKSTFSHQTIDEKKAMDTRNSPEERKLTGPTPNGTLSYKPYSSVVPPEDSSIDEGSVTPRQSRQMDESYASSRTNSTAIPNPMLISATPHKQRSLEPVRLMVDDLPYADTSS